MAAAVILLGVNIWRYGLAAQADIVVIFIVPLLFAGLLLGRPGVWVTMICYIPVLLIGVRTDSEDAAGSLEGGASAFRAGATTARFVDRRADPGPADHEGEPKQPPEPGPCRGPRATGG